jgi:hypothetical protein
LGAYLISISKKHWRLKDATDAANHLIGDGRYNLVGQIKHPPFENEPILVFRFEGGLLIGEAKFSRWDDKVPGRFCYKSFQKYPNFVAGSRFIKPQQNPYPQISVRALREIRDAARRQEQGPYIENGETEGLSCSRNLLSVFRPAINSPAMDVLDSYAPLRNQSC